MMFEKTYATSLTRRDRRLEDVKVVISTTCDLMGFGFGFLMEAAFPLCDLALATVVECSS
jgi:hypothetical protein